MPRETCVDQGFVREVRASLSTRGPKSMEIEFRLGTKDVRKSRFSPGVSREAFEAVVDALSRSPSFIECPSSVTTEYYFPNAKGRLGADGSWIEKEHFSTIDVPSLDGKKIIRASACYENAKQPPVGANPSSSSFFRKKSRRSFAWTTLPWRVDLTEIESNEDRDSEEKTFEIEVELADPSIVYVSPIENLLDCGYRIALDVSSIAAKSM